MARRRYDDDSEFEDDFDALSDEEGADDPSIDGGKDTAYCPECGAEIHDSADVCTRCFTWLESGTTRHPPSMGRARERFRRIVVFTLIGGIVLGLVFMFLARVIR